MVFTEKRRTKRGGRGSSSTLKTSKGATVNNIASMGSERISSELRLMESELRDATLRASLSTTDKATKRIALSNRAKRERLLNDIDVYEKALKKAQKYERDNDLPSF